jgi:hypothetical protein
MKLDVDVNKNKIDHKRAKCKDPKIIMPWFEWVRSTITEYGIHHDDIYNLDSSP